MSAGLKKVSASCVITAESEQLRTAWASLTGQSLIFRTLICYSLINLCLSAVQTEGLLSKQSCQKARTGIHKLSYFLSWVMKSLVLITVHLFPLINSFCHVFPSQGGMIMSIFEPLSLCYSTSCCRLRAKWSKCWSWIMKSIHAFSFQRFIPTDSLQP